MVERVKTSKREIKQHLKEHPDELVHPAQPLVLDHKTKEITQEWRHLKQRGEKEELTWTEKAMATVGAAFEYHQEKENATRFELRDNQLYYLALQVLSKGTYDFGRLETTNRGIQLPTGEGKTYCSGLAAAILTLQGEKVHIVEPNYISAQDHARQMGSFFDFLLHEEVGVVVDLSEKGQRVSEKEAEYLKWVKSQRDKDKVIFFRAEISDRKRGPRGEKKHGAKGSYMQI